jgi:hypothetical protein
MSKLATRRAVLAGWLECVFSQDAQTNFKSLHHKPRAGRRIWRWPLFLWKH